MSEQSEILDRLDKAVRLLTVLVTKDMPHQNDQILALSRVGFQPKEIAGLVGTSSNTVNVRLSEMRKRAGSTTRRGAVKNKEASQ